MNQSSSFKWHRFFSYFLLGAIVGYMLSYTISFATPNGHPLITLKHPFTPLDITLTLLTLAGACGGVLYAIRNKKLELPYKTDDGMINLGCLGDCFFGIAGAYVISLIVPGKFPSDLTNPQFDSSRVELTIQVLATGIIGGYGGRSIIDRALDNILRRQDELEDKVKSNSNQIKENIGQIEQAKEQAYSGAKALALLERYFDEDLEPTNEEDLKKLIEKTSPRERAIIFANAKQVRERNMWKKPSMVDRTIPVFEALVAVGTEDQFLHRYYAQLGYALESKSTPDWLRAEAVLSKAIKTRDNSPDKDESFWVYEFNRAVCRIKLDENFRKDKPALSIMRDPILNDLRTATQSRNHTATQFNEYLDKLAKRLKAEICKWLKLNNTSPEDIGFPKGFDSPSELSSSNESRVAEAVA